MSHPNAQPAPSGLLNREHDLLADIFWLESRLQEIDSGDCAYEKAMARSYEQTLHTRRASLAILRRERCASRFNR